MTIHQNIAGQAISLRDATEFAKWSRLARAAQDVADAIKLNTQRRSLRATVEVDAAIHSACNAAIDTVDDGDFLAMREQLQGEYGWSDDGVPDDQLLLSPPLADGMTLATARAELGL